MQRASVPRPSVAAASNVDEKARRRSERRGWRLLAPNSLTVKPMHADSSVDQLLLVACHRAAMGSLEMRAFSLQGPQQSVSLAQSMLASLIAATPKTPVLVVANSRRRWAASSIEERCESLVLSSPLPRSLS
eukprot:5044882-Pleurochrysis_carterae.AAC.1